MLLKGTVSALVSPFFSYFFKAWTVLIVMHFDIILIGLILVHI